VQRLQHRWMVKQSMELCILRKPGQHNSSLRHGRAPARIGSRSSMAGVVLRQRPFRPEPADRGGSPRLLSHLLLQLTHGSQKQPNCPTLVMTMPPSATSWPLRKMVLPGTQNIDKPLPPGTTHHTCWQWTQVHSESTFALIAPRILAVNASGRNISIDITISDIMVDGQKCQLCLQWMRSKPPNQITRRQRQSGGAFITADHTMEAASLHLTKGRAQPARHSHAAPLPAAG